MPEVEEASCVRALGPRVSIKEWVLDVKCLTKSLNLVMGDSTRAIRSASISPKSRMIRSMDGKIDVLQREILRFTTGWLTKTCSLSALTKCTCAT